MRPAPLSVITGLLASASLAGQTSPTWQYTAPASVSSFDITPLGIVLVTAEHGLVALAPDTGTVLWTREDLANVAPHRYIAVEQHPFAVLGGDGGVEIIDLLTGATRWRISPPPELQPYVPLPQYGLVLAYGSTDRHMLVALELESGAIRWEQQQPFDLVSHAESASPEPAVPVSDSSFLLYIPDYGPGLMHAGTGEWLWVPDRLAGWSLGFGPGSHAGMLPADSIVYVPFENRLHALRIRDGTPVWSEAPGFPGPIAQLELTANGLLVRGERAWLRLVDPTSGASRWTKRFRQLVFADRGDITPFLVTDSRVYVVVDQKLRVVNLEDGGMTELPAEFKGGDQPYHLERRGDGVLLIGRQNLMLVDSTGAVRYHVYYPAPGRSTLEKTGLVIATPFVGALWDQSWNPNLGKRYAASEQARSYVYSVARVADSSGRKGPAFLKLRKDDGRVMGRVWLEEKRPDYRLDLVTGMLYVRAGREIRAFRM